MESSAKLSFAIKLTRADIKACSLYISMKKHFRGSVFYYLLFGLLVFIPVYISTEKGGGPSSKALSIAGALAVFIGINAVFVLLGYLSRSGKAISGGRLLLQRELSFDEDGFAITSGRGEINYDWSAIYGVEETKGCYLLRITHEDYDALPKGYLSSEEDGALRELLIKAVAKRKLRLGKGLPAGSFPTRERETGGAEAVKAHALLELTVTLTKHEFRDSFFFAAATQPFLAVLHFLGYAALIIAATRVLSIDPLPLWFIGALLTAGLPLLILFFSNRVYKNDPTVKSPYTYIFDKNGFAVTTQRGRVVSKWSDCAGAKETKNYFFVMTPKKTVICLPKRALSGQRDEALLRGLLPPKKRK